MDEVACEGLRVVVVGCSWGERNQSISNRGAQFRGLYYAGMLGVRMEKCFKFSNPMPCSFKSSGLSLSVALTVPIDIPRL